MNKRMLELYKQAHVPCTTIDPSNNMPYETTCFSADRFAELIIKECTTICNESQAAYFNLQLATDDFNEKSIHSGGGTASFNIGRNIIDRFGADE